jgi:hypothetical protein
MYSSLCFNWAPRHEGVLGEWRYSSTHSLTWALDGGEWSVSCPGRFTPRGKAPSSHWIGGWVGRRAGLDAVVKRKIPRFPAIADTRTPDHSARSPALYHWAFPSLRSIAPRVLNFGTRWRWVVSFTLLPICPQGRAPGSHWRLGETQSRFGESTF